MKYYYYRNKNHHRKVNYIKKPRVIKGMERLISCNNKIEIKYIKLIVCLIGSNFNTIPKMILLSKNYCSDLWNSWANNLEELFFLLSNEADRR